MCDGTEKIFVNVGGRKGNVTDAFKNLMKFIMTGSVTDTFTGELKQEIIATKNNEQWRRDYMTLNMRYAEQREEGRAEGSINT